MHVNIESKSPDLVDTVKRIKDVKRRIPANGWSYFTSRFCHDESKELFKDHMPIEMLFNYLGQYQQLERTDSLLVPDALGGDSDVSDVGPRAQRMALFEISAVVIRGQLQVTFVFNKNMLRQEQIYQWLQAYEKCLVAATEVLPGHEVQMTLSDFPLLRMSYKGLEKLKYEQLASLGLSSLAELEDIYPCSPMQEGLLLSQSRQSGAYETRFTYNVTGKNGSPVNPKKMIEAWSKVVRRHAMLRTVFADSVTEGAFYDQYVLKDVQPRVLMLQSSDDEALNILQKLEIAKHGDSGPPHHLTVCVTHSGKVYCKFEASHAIIDASSLGVIFRDISLAYDDQLPSGVGPLYSRYIEYIQSKAMDSGLNYWKAHLSGIETCYFPTCPDDGDEPDQLRSISVDLGLDDKQGVLQRFCSQYGVTVPTLFQAIWAIVLRCYTGAEQVCFGYIVSGREVPVEGIQQAVGPFINMLPVVDNRPSLSAVQLLEAVQADYAAGLEHQHVSLAEIQHGLGFSEPLFNTIMSIQTAGAAGVGEAPTLSFTNVGAHDPTEFAITVNVVTSPTGASVSLSHWTKHVSSWQARNVAGTFRAAVQRLLEQPSAIVKDLYLFSDTDATQVRNWSSMRDEGVYACVHEVFDQNALLREKNAAVTGWDGDFTYDEVRRLSSQLAAKLSQLGVGPEIKVPLCFEKSKWYIVSVLAVLKAGGTCVPLGPANPHARLRDIVTDVEAPFILTSETHAELARSLLGRPPVVVSPKSLTLEITEKPSVLCNATPNNAAFIFFTSGSTGKPKGVVVTHRGICSVVPLLASTLGYTEQSRVLQFAAYTFDVSIGDIFGGLFSGSTLCVLSDDQRKEDVGDAINTLRVNQACLTPTVARTLQPKEVPTLKTLTLGGEPLTQHDVDMWAQRKDVDLINIYGVTECTIWQMTSRLWSRTVTDEKNIGTAFTGAVWMVDPADRTRLAPVGTIGELVLGGPGVAREYLNDQVKTNAAFYSCPGWQLHDGSLYHGPLYRTGDLVKYNEDGTMSFVGRADKQIKVNGQRVELGEVEYHVKKGLPETRAVAVDQIMPTGFLPKAILVAFFSPLDLEKYAGDSSEGGVLSLDSELQAQIQILMATLADSLPVHMIPSMFVPLRQLPQTSSGKTDRKVLKDIIGMLSQDQVSAFSLAESQKRQPETRDEAEMQRLWAAVLKRPIETVGLDDSFFRLGGDSILAMHLILAAREAGFSLRANDVFAYPRLVDMAAFVGTQSRGNMDTTYPPVEPFSLVSNMGPITQLLADLAQQCGIQIEEIEDAYPATPLQEGLMLLSKKQVGAYVNRTTFVLPKGLDLKRFKAAWQSTVDAVSILRARIVYMKGVGTMQVVTRQKIEWGEGMGLEGYVEEDGKVRLEYHTSMLLKPTNSYFFFDRCRWTSENRLHGMQLSLNWPASHTLYSLRITLSTMAGVFPS